MSAAETLRPGRYRHFKGKEYELLFVATHSETLEPMVVYRALYGERGLWARPLAMWSEAVERDGVTQPRFAYVCATEADLPQPHPCLPRWGGPPMWGPMARGSWPSWPIR